MDQSTMGFVSYRYHRICNPFSFDQLERVLAFTDLKPEERGLDIGCGNGVVAARIAERLGLDMTGIERNGPMAALARETAAGIGAKGRLTVVEGQAGNHLATAGEHRLVSVIGAIDVFPDRLRPADVMQGLAPAIAPGGWLLWGDPFWKKPPSEALEKAFGAQRYESLSGWLQAGQAAGLQPRYCAVSTDADWEEYLWRMNASIEDWADEHPDSPEAAMFRMRAAMLRHMHMTEGRDTVGFGLYLFRRPPA